MTNSTGKFKLITNDKFKKAMKPKCTVKIGDSVDNFDDFVTIGFDTSADSCVMIHNADVVTLAQAMDLIQTAYYNAYTELSTEEQKELRELLVKC